MLTRVAKTVVEPESDAIKWGNRVHKALEDYLLRGTPLPEGMESYAKLADKIAEKAAEPGAELSPERKIALSDSYKPVEYFARNVWVRGVLDVSLKKGANGLIADWKTGKIKPDSDQLKLFAALAFASDPELQTVNTVFLWVAEGKVTAERFVREDATGIWQEFLPRVARLQMAHQSNKWPARPSGLCAKWCPCLECEHNGRRGK